MLPKPKVNIVLQSMQICNFLLSHKETKNMLKLKCNVILNVFNVIHFNIAQRFLSMRSVLALCRLFVCNLLLSRTHESRHC